MVPFFFCIAFQPVIEYQALQFPAPQVLQAYCDDLTLGGPTHIVYNALVSLQTYLLPSIGLWMNPSKSYVHFPLGTDLSVFDTEGLARSTTDGLLILEAPV